MLLMSYAVRDEQLLAGIAELFRYYITNSEIKAAMLISTHQNVMYETHCFAYEYAFKA